MIPADTAREREEVSRAIESMNVIKTMIDFSADRLEGLRTQCATSAELTQQEIRTLEGKLVKLFSRQLVVKRKIPANLLPPEFCSIPSVRQWLQVVGLGDQSKEAILCHVSSLEALGERPEREVRQWLGENGEEEEARRLARALCSLRKYTEVLLLQGEKGDPTSGTTQTLSWDSWDPCPESPRLPNRTRIASESDMLSNNGHPLSINNKSISPPSTPTLKSQRIRGKPTTPPLKRKLQAPNIGLQSSLPIAKSRSHESQLLSNEGGGSPRAPTPLQAPPPPRKMRGRLPTEPGPGLTALSPSPPPPPSPSPSLGPLSPPASSSLLQVPPRTPTLSRSMGHVIAHRFAKTFHVLTTCDYCDKQMFIGLKCKECKYKCHRDCQVKVPPSCCLPPEFLDVFANAFHGGESPVLGHPRHKDRGGGLGGRHQRKRSGGAFVGADSSSNTSSCNSSTPSSPALLPAQTTPTPRLTVTSQFHFPETTTSIPVELTEVEESKDQEDTNSKEDSQEAPGSPGNTDAVGSSGSERTAVGEDLEGVDGMDGSGREWPRQNSLSMREWDIPFEELKLGEALGVGRFGTVFRASWHGDVVVKVLQGPWASDPEALKAFKQEVATLRKTRHENLVLFMGACTHPPRLAIVTSLCKGRTLYAHLHHHRDKFSATKTAQVAQQVAQGVGYLHARGIVHKDLRSKNIFLENGKVVITDFGLFALPQPIPPQQSPLGTSLVNVRSSGERLRIPPGWLCYLAPELVRQLRPPAYARGTDLPFSMSSDVFAFGTLWYELVSGEWPWAGQPPEAVIWQVGRGLSPALAHLQASRDAIAILASCWSTMPRSRPDFASLRKRLENLPRKRLARSPSHPLHLSRSAESVF